VVGSLTRRQQEQLSRTFCRLVPVFADLDLQPTSDGMHELRFQDRWSDGLWYRPEQVSDGTMLMVAFLALRYQSEPVELLTIEEPDRGLHPYLMEQVISFLRTLSEPKEPGMPPIQIVVATHSAELLEYCRPEEVRFLDRNTEDGSLRVHQIDTASPDWQETFDTYRQSLGSVWLSGGLGGVPGR
jgi:predicted ATPase